MRSTIFWLAAMVMVAACGDDATPMDASAGDVGPCTTNTECDDGVYCNGSEQCDMGVCTASAPPCGVGMTCDEAMETCQGACDNPDADGDNHASVECGGDDCDDTDGNRFPSNPEVCDSMGHDEDCNPSTLGERDVDLDGHIDAACCNDDLCGLDCADRLPAVFPGASETCNLRDDDCDGTVDEGETVELHRDEDGDLHGTDPTILACAGSAGTTTSTLDCADDNRAVHGAQLEICDGLDNDCDDTADEAVAPLTWYTDVDNDGFGNPSGTTLIQCDPPGVGYSLVPTDCDDGNAALSPIAPELCNALDDDCDGVPSFEIELGDTEDDDRDGFADATCGGPDCDDLDPYAYAGAPELADGVDNDCDSVVDEEVETIEWFVDTDEDGTGGVDVIMSNMRERGRVPRGGDCDDGDPARVTGGREICDGIDNDCDDRVDEDAYGMRAWYLDMDGDNYGRPEGAVVACDAPDGFVESPGDCDDTNGTVAPGATEVCDMLDNDCDITVDEDAVPVGWYVDNDGDNYGVGDIVVTTCVPPANHALNADDCNDMNSSINPGADETCNGMNDDCDANTDEGVLTTYYRDQDMDGAGDATMPMTACTPPMGFVTRMDDCDDMDINNFPGNPEVCDLQNNDCDLASDEGLAVLRYYQDGDGDMYAPDGAPTLDACAQPDDYTLMLGDCNDMDANIHPDATEDCDGVNQDCDMATDEGPASAMCNPAIHPDLTGACVAPPVAAGECACMMSGVGECNNDPTDGCETDTTRNPLHCGVCGNPCGSSEFCDAGVCAPAPIEEIVGNGNVTCARRAGGILQCWGTATSLLGSVAYTATAVLPQFEILSHASTRNRSAGQTHQCIVVPSAAGAGGTDIYCWGRNNQGQCGDGTSFSTVPAPRRIAAAVDDVVEDWVQVVAPSEYTLARRANGEVYSWGGSSGGNSGQLGRDVVANDNVPGAVIILDDAIDIAGAFSHACAVRGTNGEVWCWGSDSFDRSGDGPLNGNGFTPQPVVADTGSPTPVTGFVEVECHDNGGCALNSDGSVSCWGLQALGTGDSRSQYANQVPGVVGATDIACGVSGHCCAVVAGGIVKCWGQGSAGQLGHNASPLNEAMPVNVQLSPGPSLLIGATSISASDATTCVTMPGNQVTCWGSGNSGQLGDGITTNHARNNAGAPDFVVGL